MCNIWKLQRKFLKVFICKFSLLTLVVSMQNFIGLFWNFLLLFSVLFLFSFYAFLLFLMNFLFLFLHAGSKKINDFLPLRLSCIIKCSFFLAILMIYWASCLNCFVMFIHQLTIYMPHNCLLKRHKIKQFSMTKCLNVSHQSPV